uniref:AMDV2_17 n=1 Tax=uncultured virus TaxID=340016 RepID=B3GAL6_9VIRU|nr:AMDV2_17 [uncultured virus]
MEFTFSEKELELLFKYASAVTMLELQNKQLTNKEILAIINESHTTKFTFDELVKIIVPLIQINIIQKLQ